MQMPHPKKVLKRHRCLSLTCRGCDFTGLGWDLHIYLFYLSTFYEYFETYKAVKRLYSEQPYTQHLDTYYHQHFAVCFNTYLSIIPLPMHSSILFFDAFQSKLQASNTPSKRM